jgi:hypothetical protein
MVHMSTPNQDMVENTPGLPAGSAGVTTATVGGSRQRVTLALAHKEPDRVPLDLGGAATAGICANALYRLRQALGLDAPGTPLKIVELMTMQGEVGLDLVEALGIDVLRVGMSRNIFGFENEGWKPWTLFDGTPVLVPEKFNTDPEPDGSVLQYPEGDKSVPASGRMPKGGLYFDALNRQGPIDDEHLDPHDNLEEFGPVSAADLEYVRLEADRLYSTGKALIGDFGGTAFGDVAWVPALHLKQVKGIRDISEWYASLSLRSEYIYEVFEHQCEIGIANLAKIHEVVGDKLTVIFLTGTDFGSQNGPLVSPRTYRTLFQPFHARVNEWVHTHTNWKTFMHCCGSIWRLLDDIADAGFDALNPVQTSAADMDPRALKDKYGQRITFWGGGVDTQRVLPFGTPEEVREMVRDRIRIFGEGGGFVFSAIHNVQDGVPTENLLALFQAVRDFSTYPLG